eukprot:scaffold10643_cov151-Amphora_coffeaeformis.AAC.8
MEFEVFCEEGSKLHSRHTALSTVWYGCTPSLSLLPYYHTAVYNNALHSHSFLSSGECSRPVCTVILRCHPALASFLQRFMRDVWCVGMPLYPSRCLARFRTWQHRQITYVKKI